MPKVYYITKWWNTSFELNQFLCRVRINSILFPSRKVTTIFCRSATLSTSASAATWPAHCRTLIVPTWFSTSAFTYVYKILMYEDKFEIYLVISWYSFISIVIEVGYYLKILDSQTWDSEYEHLLLYIDENYWPTL